MVEAKDVIIIGGGFAGLSAGVALAEKGFRVALLESKPALGGRAYSFADPESGDFVDNGQHVLMGCYTETLDFLDRIGAEKNLVFHHDLEIEMLDRGGARATLKTAHLPGPFHMSSGLLRYRHLTIGQRLRVLTGGLKLLAMQRRDPSALQKMTVEQLMDALGQGERARQAFWYPLSIATLNDEPEVSSAALLARSFEARLFFQALRFRICLFSRRSERSLLHRRREPHRAQWRRCRRRALQSSRSISRTEVRCG